MIRPELLARILRWREAAIGGGAALLGLYWAVFEPGVMRWVGVAFVLGGVAILREGLARGRRPRDGGGAGIVDVNERQIAYLSGHGGGAVSLDALDRVAVDVPQRGTVRWVIEGSDGTRLEIPLDAEGAGQIFDAVAALPGVTHAETLAATRAAAPGGRTLWQRHRPRLH